VTNADRKPLWLYPNLLSLDAPLVAVLWLHIFAKTWGLGYHPWQAYLTLALAVWVIYVGDRLLDISLFGANTDKLGPRHHFHNRHRKWLMVLVALAIGIACFFLLTQMPRTIFKYLILGGVFVAGFFGLSMLSSQDGNEVPYSKNILAGLTFAYGTAMTAHMYRGEFDLNSLLFSREFICFGTLCILNIAAIDLWEHAGRVSDIEIKASDELALTLPLIVLFFASLVFAAMDDSTQPFHYAILTGAALLYVLNRVRAQLSMDALRVLADVALMVPALVFQAASMKP
jgi:hypothetical protein